MTIQASPWQRRPWALAVVTAVVALAAACGATGDDDGVGVVPTAAELRGHWSVLDTADDHSLTVWRFAATLPDRPDIADATDVYEVWQAFPDQALALAQRGRYRIEGGALRTEVTWDPWYPCSSDFIGPCPTLVGKAFSNKLLAFSGKSLTMQSKNAASGKRTYTRSEDCPAPPSRGVFAVHGAPWGCAGFGGCGYPEVVVDGKGVPHLFTGTAAEMTLRHAERDGCGWRVEDVAAGRPTTSIFRADGALGLHGVYYALDDNHAYYTRRGAAGWVSEKLGDMTPATFAVDAAQTPVLLATASAAPFVRFGRRGTAGWTFEGLVDVAPSGVSVGGMAPQPDGSVDVLYLQDGAWTRATRGKDGAWTSALTSLPCSAMLDLHAASGGGLQGLCLQAIVNSGYVSKSSQFAFARLEGDAWTLEPLDEALLGRLTLDADGHPHVALLRNGSLTGTNGLNLLLGDRRSGDWALQHGGDGGGLIRAWTGVALAIAADGTRWVHYGESFGVVASAITPVPPRAYSLTLTLPAGAKGVRVRSIPAGIDCPGSCAAPFAPETRVRLRVELDAPHSVAGTLSTCAVPAGKAATTWECRVSVRYADVSDSLELTPAPVRWAGLLGSAGDDAVEHADVRGEATWAVGRTGGAATFAGLSAADAGADALVVAKLGGDGAPAWLRAFAATRAPGSVRRVAATGTGAAVIGLTTTAPLTLDGKAATAAGATVVRLDADGKATFVRALFKDGGGTVRAVHGLDDGSVLVSGLFAGGDAGAGVVATAGGDDGFVARLGADLSLQWLRVVGSAQSDMTLLTAANGAGELVGVLRAPGDVVFDGKAQATGLSGSGSWLFGLSADGALVWSNAETGSGLLAPALLARAPDGGLVVTTNNGLNLVYRYAKGGALQWETTTQTGTIVRAIDVGADGRVLAVGTFSGGISKQTVPQVALLSAAGEVTTPFAINLDQVPTLARWVGADVLLGGETATGATFGPLVLAGVGGVDGWLARLPLP